MLYDDRDVSPGVKFADADLVGVPVQLVVGAKGVGRGVVERKVRATGERDELPLARPRRPARLVTSTRRSRVSARVVDVVDRRRRRRRGRRRARAADGAAGSPRGTRTPIVTSAIAAIHAGSNVRSVVWCTMKPPPAARNASPKSSSTKSVG